MQCSCCFRENLPLFIVTCDACYNADPTNSSQCKSCIDARRRVNNHLVCTKCSAPTKVITTYRWRHVALDVRRILLFVFKNERGGVDQNARDFMKFLAISWIADSFLLHLLDFPFACVALHHACIGLMLCDLRMQIAWDYRRPFLEHATVGYIVLHFFYILIFGAYFVSLILLRFLPFVGWTHALLPMLANVLVLFHGAVLFFFAVLIIRYMRHSMNRARRRVVDCYSNCYVVRSREFMPVSNSITSIEHYEI